MKVLTLKSILISAIATLGIAAGSASAAPTLDTLLGGNGFNLGNSGAGTVLAKLNQLTGESFSLNQFETDSTPTAIMDAGTGYFVINLDPGVQAGYFVLKFGTGSTNTDLNTYFFKNIADLQQLVFSNAQVNFLTGGNCVDDRQGNLNDPRCNIGRLSHVRITPNGSGTPVGTPVSEPASLAMFCAGLAVLGSRRRRT